MDNTYKFASSINKSKVKCNCMICGEEVIMKTDPNNFIFGVPYTILCDRCMLIENSNRMENKLLHVIRMVTNANK